MPRQAGQQSLEGWNGLALASHRRWRQNARRSSRPLASASKSRAVLINTATLERWPLVQTTTVAIACATGAYALLFSRVSGCQGNRNGIGIARMTCLNTQRQKHYEECGDDGKRPLAAFHGSAPLRSKKTKNLAQRRRHRGDEHAAAAPRPRISVIVYNTSTVRTHRS